ncbi:MAG: hypothetical protein BRD45_05950, partial [Bacteroidetes bacterium QS_8_64_10]
MSEIEEIAMRHCSPIPSLLTAAALLLVAALPARAQVPLHEQDREWVNIAPDSIENKTFELVEVGYFNGQRVIYAKTVYRDPETGKYVGGLLRTDDEGETWKVLSQRPTHHASLWAKDANLIYTVTDYRLYKSRDGGETWQDLTPQAKQADLANGDGAPISDFAPTDVAVSPFDSAKVF